MVTETWGIAREVLHPYRYIYHHICTYNTLLLLQCFTVVMMRKVISTTRKVNTMTTESWHKGHKIMWNMFWSLLLPQELRLLWSFKFSIALIQFVSYITTPSFLDRFWLSYRFENVDYDILDNFVFKYIHEFKYNLNADEIYTVVDVFLILNFFAKLLSNFGKLKIITTSAIAFILSTFELYLISCTHL